MTNIFNKTILVRNGTLIGNWYEEEVLRERTGVGRTTPGIHIPKKTGQVDSEISSNTFYQKDQTFPRTMGQRLESGVSTTNTTYGRFTSNESKYKKAGVKEKIFEDFFKAYVDNEQAEKSKLDSSIKNLRLYDTSHKDVHSTQPKNCTQSPIGRRHMMTQDAIPIQNVDKLFMASHDMSKYPNLLNETQVGGYVDKFIPYYKDKEITYWSMNLDKGNVSRSHTLGQNPFAKSSGFTQTIHDTKAVKLFNGNVTNSKESKNIHLDNFDNEFSEKYRNSISMQNVINSADLSQDILQKIVGFCTTKGWLGIRKLRLFLRNLYRRSTSLIHRNDFKYHFINFGIAFSEKECDFAFQQFDHRKNCYVDFNELLDSFTSISEERMRQVEMLFEQIKSGEIASFKKMEKLFKPDQHPEALYSNRTSQEIRYEFLTMWDNLKEDDIVVREKFIMFFRDVSTCVHDDDLFKLCLKSCGMD